MGWTVVAQGDADNFNSTGVIETLPHGTPIKLEITTLPGLAYLANMWGADWVIERFLVEDISISDTYSNGSDLVIVEGYINSPAITTIVALILIVISIAGIGYIIHNLKLWAELPGGIGDLATIVKWGAIGAVGVLGIKLISRIAEGARV